MRRATPALAVITLLLASTTADASTSFKILQDQSDMEVTITGRFTDANGVTVEYQGNVLSGSDTQPSGAKGSLEVELTWDADVITQVAITDLDLSADPEVNFSFAMGGLTMDMDLLGLNVSTHPSTPALGTPVSGGAFSFDEDDNLWLGTADVDYTAFGLLPGSTDMAVAFREPVSGAFTEPGGVLTMTFDLDAYFGETVDLADWGIDLTEYGIVYAVVEAEVTGTITAVPEPTTGGLFVLGMAGVGAWLRRRR